MNRFALQVAILTLMGWLSAAEGLEFAVHCGKASSGGNEFSSLEAARAAVAAIPRPLNSSIVVNIQGDCYLSDGQLELHGNVDSGEYPFTITYRKDPSASHARLISGIRLPSSAFGPIPSNDPLKPLLNPNFVDSVVVANLSAFGFSETEVGHFSAGGLGQCGQTRPQLYMNGTPMQLARYPNAPLKAGPWMDWMRVKALREYQPGTPSKKKSAELQLPLCDGLGRKPSAKQVSPLTQLISSDVDESQRCHEYPMDSTNTTFSVTDPLDELSTDRFPAALETLGDVWMQGYWSWDWADSYVRLQTASPTPKVNGSWTFTYDPSTPPVYGLIPNARFYVVNALSELDAPGEYYIDRQSLAMYFFPPSPLTDDSEIVLGISDLANGNRPFIRSGSRSELHDVRFEGLTVTDGGSREAMALLNATRVEVVNLVINNFNRNALIFQGQHSIISGLTSSGMGCSVISANGGNTQTLQTSNITIRDSDLSEYGRWVRSYSAAVHFGGSGINVFHNKIHTGPHTGLLGYGVLHTFTQNTLHNLLYGSSDAGAFYIGRSWVDRGMVVDGNVFYDLNVIEPTTCPVVNQMVHGIYLDDEQSGVVVKGNLCRNCTNGIIVGGGRHNSVLGNRCEGVSASHPQTQRSCVQFDNRGMNWQHSACSNSSGQPGLLVEQLYQVDYKQPPYSFAFPDIVNTLQDRPCVPVQNVFIGNSFCGLGEFLSVKEDDVVSWGSYAAENTEDYNC